MYGQIARTYLAILLACAGVSACDDISGNGCGLAPCPAELVVEVHGPQDVTYTVDVSASGKETRTELCLVLSDDTCAIYLRDFGPAEVTVRVTWSDQEVTGQFSPAYETIHPNGPDCSASSGDLVDTILLIAT